ncbi:MAG: hypothetical protein J6O61_12050 [Butyrivibrio sp.]|uniref:hypothetical protein n=1 Tax=Butyrivibrio sp. TaxID=28121 RepID=UPI001B1F16CE|nr:hypothetical protein [Butyrivibrio sp.]MBO6241549.1 hypothetical protein [Butyrivibrio sp.]
MKRINQINDSAEFDDSEEALDELVRAISKMHKQEDEADKALRTDPRKNSEGKEN